MTTMVFGRRLARCSGRSAGRAKWVGWDGLEQVGMTKDYGVELKDALGWGWGRLWDTGFEVTTAQ